MPVLISLLVHGESPYQLVSLLATTQLQTQISSIHRNVFYLADSPVGANFICVDWWNSDKVDTDSSQNYGDALLLAREGSPRMFTFYCAVRLLKSVTDYQYIENTTITNLITVHYKNHIFCNTP